MYVIIITYGLAGLLMIFTVLTLYRLLRQMRVDRARGLVANRAIGLVQRVNWRDLPDYVPIRVMRAVSRGDYETVIALLEPFEPTWEGKIDG